MSVFDDLLLGLTSNMANDEIQKVIQKKDGLSFHEYCLLSAFGHCVKMIPKDFNKIKSMTKEERKEMADVVAKLAFAVGHQFYHRCATAKVHDDSDHVLDHNHDIV